MKKCGRIIKIHILFLPAISEADPGFPVGGAPIFRGNSNIQFCRLS